MANDIVVAALSLDEYVYTADSISNAIDSTYFRMLSVGKSTGRLLSEKTILALSVIQSDLSSYNNILSNNKQNPDSIYIVNTCNLDGFNNRIVNVASPQEKTDVATKGYVDTLIHGFENGIYHYSSLTPNTTYYKYQTPNILSGADIYFPNNVDIFNGLQQFRLFNITLWTNKNGDIPANTKITLVDLTDSKRPKYNSNYLTSIQLSGAITFSFDSPPLIDISHKYFLSVSNSSGEPQGIRVEVAAGGVDNGNVYRYNGSPLNKKYLYIHSMEVSKQ